MTLALALWFALTMIRGSFAIKSKKELMTDKTKPTTTITMMVNTNQGPEGP